MKKVLTNASILNKVNENGFCHIKYPESSDYKDIIDSIGEIILKTEIKENHNSTRLLSSNKSMSFHTDHIKAKYIAWFCNSQSAFGGESLLMDSKNILKKLSSKTISLLKEVNINTHKVFCDDKISLPLLSTYKDQTIIYYAKWLTNPLFSIRHEKALSSFELKFIHTKIEKILLSEGDLLIIDNHRMLHGRNEFPIKSNRWLTRFWIKSNTH